MPILSLMPCHAMPMPFPCHSMPHGIPCPIRFYALQFYKHHSVKSKYRSVPTPPYSFLSSAQYFSASALSHTNTCAFVLRVSCFKQSSANAPASSPHPHISPRLHPSTCSEEQGPRLVPSSLTTTEKYKAYPGFAAGWRA